MLDQTLTLPEDPEELRSLTARLLAEVKAQAILIEKLRHQLAMSSDTHLYELRRHPVLRGMAQQSGPGGRADRQESRRALRGRGSQGY